jgi:hypothetical protein
MGHLFILVSVCEPDSSIKQFNMLCSGIDLFHTEVMGSLIN